MKKQSGIVYVLTNPAMPGFVKIGLTKGKTIEKRLANLSNTSVPLPFTIEYACKVNDCFGVEKALHNAFSQFRAPRKEFFRIDPNGAIGILKLLSLKVVTLDLKKTKTKNYEVLTCKLKRKGISANGFMMKDGFMVKKGSTVNKSTVNMNLINDLIKDNILCEKMEKSCLK